MLRVNQEALAHNTNVAYVGVRQNELSYFNAFFSGFGVQIALLAGFNINIISQTVSYDATCNIFWMYFYYINNSLGAAMGILAILIALLTNVYAQGLALRGPVGSMVRAIDGMVEEQQLFLICFTITTICTTFCLIGDFFIMMELPGAWCAGGIMFFGMFYWARSCLRIYNRFHFSNEKDMLRASNQASEFNEEFSNSIDMPHSPYAKVTAADGAIPQPSSSNNNNGPADNNNNDYDDDDDEPGTGTGGMVFQYAGNISIRTTTTTSTGATGVGISSTSWPRYYLVLKGRYGLYYKDKKAFEMFPMKPINNRPIHLNEYVVDTKIDTGDNYLLNLIPADPEDYRKVWEFRVDTEGELATWKRELEKVCARAPLQS